ncbi:DNA internalization-related competence protein ComEC/Rec2 [Vibrio nitrifigilis]|uniref:DNA internalization-related competence protein ComEC/Rec2 n=1 Tax=Vibrio nitrifigilis TaxID=2789781 RepID=A0ABS0GC50_9VIBR|nr:DNA internalization-related competence protein ComEC/Rec2 [Vibrio nitrifigilis]MBF8999988.1 DNA internalization-related competence protein ComEC/Rec2 [Vibrio nitrifigilis]
MTLLFNNWVLISFSLTAISSIYWPFIPGWEPLLAAIGTGVICVVILGCRSVIGIALAVVLILTHSQLLSAQKHTLFQFGSNITINAHVDSFFKPVGDAFQGDITVTEINHQPIFYLFQPKIRLTSPIILTPNQSGIFHVSVKPMFGHLNDVGFDKETYAISEKIVAKASVYRDSAWSITTKTTLRNWWYQEVLHIAQGSDKQGLILALLFGERSRLTPDQWQQLRNSGLSHLVAISGLHIGIAFGLGFLIGSVFSRLSPLWLWAPWLLGAAVAIGYAWLAGFTLPTQRAVIMCITNVVLLMTSVRVGTLGRLNITLAVVLLVYPFAAYSSSLWLSFFAVSAVIYLASWTQHYAHTWQKLFLIQIGVTLFMVPITGYFFHGVSVTSVLFNLVFIPWFSYVIVPLGFLLLLALVCGGWGANYVWQCLDWAFAPLLHALQWSEGSWINFSREWTLTVLFVLIAFISTLLIRKRWAACMTVLVLSHLWSSQPRFDWRVEVLDVGHGLAVLIRQNDKVLVYDTGSGWDTGSMANSVIKPLVAYYGETLDAMIVSHTDNDHAGGRYDIEPIISHRHQWASQRLSGYRPCIRGETWWWESLSFEVLWPPKQVHRAYNQHSCVIMVRDIYHRHSILLTGDVNAVGEWLLARGQDNLNAEVMLVPHHGSGTSSTAQLIDKVSPMWAIASLAKGNLWHLPSSAVVKRYTQHGAHWLDTGDSGQISVIFHGNDTRIERKRSNDNQPWYRQMLRNGVE